MNKINYLICIISLVFCLYGCTQKTGTTECDSTITDWTHFISKKDATTYIENLDIWKLKKPTIDSSNLATAEFFMGARDMMRNMMLRDSCVGIRVYYGLKDGRIIPIICGTKKDGSNIYWNRSEQNAGNKVKSVTGDDDDGLMDASQPEPPAMTPILPL